MVFEKKDIDYEGLKILDVLSTADKFNRWIYDTISYNCSGNILEIGSGIGNIAQYFILDHHQITLSDLRQNYRDYIKKKFNLNDDKILNINISDVDFKENYPHLLGRFDSVFILNVLEHIKEDRRTINNLMSLLKDNGKLTVLVPAHQFLYNGIDKSLEHYKRYNKKTINELISTEYKISKIHYFNAAGILAWFIGGKIFKRNSIPLKGMNIYNYLVPIWKFIDIITFSKIGLSVVCVINKKTAKD